MYGLTSRESLAKRQLKWVRDVDESVRSNPAQRSIHRDPPPNPIRDKTSIISLMSDPFFMSSEPDTIPIPESSSSSDQSTHRSNQALASKQHSMVRKSSSSKSSPFSSHFMNVIPDDANEELEMLYNMITDLKRNYDELKQDYISLRRIVDQTSSFSDRLISLETVSPKPEIISNFNNRILNLERSMSELSSRSAIPPKSPPRPDPRAGVANSSDFSLIPTSDVKVTSSSTPLELIKQVRHGRREFLPYYIKEDYAGRDNLTILDGVHFDMIVEIIGHYNEPPIIYPFGDSTDLPNFTPFTMELQFQDADMLLNGSAYGSFKRNKNGIYTIEIIELNSDGEASGIENYTLPLTLRCKMDLFLE